MSPALSDNNTIYISRKSWVRRIFAFSFLIFFMITGVSKAAAGPEELYEKGNSSYENEDYAKAVSFYEELVRMDRVSPEVFYNLGNSYFKLKKIGRAILNYERSLRMDPGDRDGRFNLRLAKAMTVDKINTSERGLVLSALLFLYDRADINGLSLICAFLYLSIILILSFSIFFVAGRKFLFYITWTFGAVFFILSVFLFAKISSENLTKTGVIVAEKADARSGPKDDYLLQFTLHEGTEVVIVKEAQEWYQIELSKDLKGWIPKTSVDII